MRLKISTDNSGIAVVNDANNSNNNNITTKPRTPTPTVAPALLFPGFCGRRYSDSHQILLAKPTIVISEDENNEDGETGGVAAGMNRRRANSYSPIMPNPSGGDEIVCSTGELMNLKCLSRSAMEMRALQSHEFGPDLGTAARRGSMFHASTTTTGNLLSIFNHLLRLTSSVMS